MLVDTHCHLTDSKFDDDRELVIKRAKDAGVSQIIFIGDNVKSSSRAAVLAEEFGMAATAGVHPHEASKWSDEARAQVAALLDQEAVVAVGEVGLDYHYDHSPRNVQRSVFEEQLELAEEFDLPVVIHSRDADSDVASMVGASNATLVLHSFSSGDEVFQAGMDRDAYVSFSGMITFKSWSDLNSVRSVPEDRILMETDSPYLAPVPFRGKRNEPAYVVEVARRMAEIRGISFEMMSEITTRNAARCFGSRVSTRV